MDNIMVILYAVLSAVLYSLIWYAKAWATTIPPEPFNVTKFAATLIVGAGVGLLFWITDLPITQEAIQQQLLIYGAVTAVVETLLKLLLAKLGIKYPGQPAPTPLPQ